ncbi:MAG: HEAT repeat domain-containing protein [Elusimicrobiota bacterium]
MNRKIIIIFTMIIMSLNYLALNSICQENKSIDALMGISIQNYLEGNIKEAASKLDEILIREPDNKRARELLKKASLRIAENSKSKGNMKEGLKFLEMAHSHLPESVEIKKKINEFRKAMELPLENSAQADKNEQINKKDSKKESEKSSDKEKMHEQKIAQLNSYIRKLKRQISLNSGGKNKLTAQFGELRSEKQKLEEDLISLKEKNKKRNFITTIFAAFTLVLICGGFAGAYFVYKKDNTKLMKNIIRERRTVEDLRESYSKNMKELDEKMAEFRKSNNRTEELEENWARVIEIIERLSRGGSTGKVVLKEGPDGRKAVTGIDPRTRARADSVEVIAEIFKDSPRAVEMLKPFLDDKDNRTRANAAVAYHQYDPEKAITVLREMSRDDDKWMRLSAAWALGEIGDSATAKVLEELLDDSDEDVKEKARRSLEKIIGKKDTERKIKEKK